MDAKPQRRSAKSSITVYSDKSKMNAGSGNENAVLATSKATGLQSRAKRAAFQDLSNSMKATVLTDKKVEGPAKKTASQPALRASAPLPKTNASASNASVATGVKAHQPMGSKVIVPKTTVVYQDKPTASVSSNAAPLRKENVSLRAIKEEVVNVSEEKATDKTSVAVAPDTASEGKKDTISKSSSTAAVAIVSSAPEKAIYSYSVNEEMKVGVVEANVDSDATDPDVDFVEGDDHAVVSDDEYDDNNAPFTSTSGITVTLYPRVTARDRREIEIASVSYAADDGNDEEASDEFDITMVQEYCKDIFDHLRDMELRLLPNPNYMDHQNEIQWSMRSILIDWMVQVHGRFQLLPETLYLAVNYVDRFLSAKIVSLNKLQLVGAVAIFIAAKYEEVTCPSISEMEWMVDRGYTGEEIQKAERYMLSLLRYELGWPGPMSFLRRVSKADDYDLETRTLAKYLTEITTMDERFIGSPPSFVAAGAYYLSRYLLGKGQWTEAHVYYSGYTYQQIKPLVQVLFECCENPRQHHNAVYEKYTEKRHKRSSVFVETWIANALNGA